MDRDTKTRSFVDLKALWRTWRLRILGWLCAKRKFSIAVAMNVSGNLAPRSIVREILRRSWEQRKGPF